ncbi:MAG TPA: hypothetical protein P5204_01675 [Kiritimatiellia bacterium]|nr:hypothetical protein [Kiritimatiellia bacterium]
MMKKATVLACAALVGCGAAFGGLISEDPGELAVSGLAFLPDHADCDLFALGLGAQVSYREWFSFPWGVGVNLGVSQWQVDDASNAFKIKYVKNYDGEALVIPFGASLFFNVIDWDNWNLIFETGLQYAFVESSVDAYNEDKDRRQEADIGGAVLWNLGAEYEYMVSENVYLTGALGYQQDVLNEDSKFDGKTVRDVTFGGGYARLGAKFLF